MPLYAFAAWHRRFAALSGLLLHHAAEQTEHINICCALHRTRRLCCSAPAYLYAALQAALRVCAPLHTTCLLLSAAAFLSVLTYQHVNSAVAYGHLPSTPLSVRDKRSVQHFMALPGAAHLSYAGRLRLYLPLLPILSGAGGRFAGGLGLGLRAVPFVGVPSLPATSTLYVSGVVMRYELTAYICLPAYCKTLSLAATPSPFLPRPSLCTALVCWISLDRRGQTYGAWYCGDVVAAAGPAKQGRACLAALCLPAVILFCFCLIHALLVLLCLPHTTILAKFSSPLHTGGQVHWVFI